MQRFAGELVTGGTVPPGKATFAAGSDATA